MPRQNTDNRFNKAGETLVKSSKHVTDNILDDSKTDKTKVIDTPKKDKVITAKVYPETWANFTAINKSQGMTNNSVINMLISNYVREKKVLLEE